MMRNVSTQHIRVHGDIRHLDMEQLEIRLKHCVHGDIRHLEIICYVESFIFHVHGDIRHLEIYMGH